jgi:GT2 family glycosyltransferase
MTSAPPVSDPGPLVYVLIINWNGRAHLEECFSTLLETTYAPVRLLLIDNASSDDSIEFVEARFGGDPRVEVLKCERNLGWSGGNNAGIEYALERGARYLFLLNNDTVTDGECIERLVREAEGNAGLGAIAPKILMYECPEILNSVGLRASRIGAAWDIGIGRLDGPEWNERREVIGVCGAACFLRVEALEKTGLLPEDFEIYLDDLDLCLRIWNAGYTIRTCPEAVVRHKFSASMGAGKQAQRKYYLNTRNRLRVVLRNYPVSAALAIGWAYDMGEFRAIGRALLNADFRRIWAHGRSWLSGLLYLPSAIRERRRRKPLGISTCRFWNLISKCDSFFPGTEFPQDGWYSPVEGAGRVLRPMARHASVQHAGGDLKIELVNRYPALEALSVSVSTESALVASLESDGASRVALNLPAGAVHFEANRILKAEETGERVDIGGWIALD